MHIVVDAVWAVWSIAAGVYDYFHTSAMEERIHTLENVLSIHQFVIAAGNESDGTTGFDHSTLNLPT
ncbi:unnamed protein product [Knipowitschia caucasica]